MQSSGCGHQELTPFNSQSKECQKLAWPGHKTQCKLKQLSRTLNSDAFDKQQQLREFTGKHRPTLCEAGVRALDLGRNSVNAERSFLLVEVHSRPSARAELSFYATGAGVVEYKTLNQHSPLFAEDMLRQRAILDAQQRELGLTGAFFFVLRSVDTGVYNIAGVGFAKHAVYKRPMPWKDFLARTINEGILH